MEPASGAGAAAAGAAGEEGVPVANCEADLPCGICGSELFTFDNDILRCKACKIVVHQDCYGVAEAPKQSFWYCMKCLPHNTSRSAKLRCRYCPMKEGAMRVTSQDGWAHIVCALYIDGLGFEPGKPRERVLVTNVAPQGQAGCCICADKRSPDTNVGNSVQCDVPDCLRRMHVTCAHNLQLAILGPRTVDHPPAAGRIVCPQHKSTLDGDWAAPSEKASKKKANRTHKPRSDHTVASAGTPPVAGSSGRGTPITEPAESYTCKICDRSFPTKSSLTTHRRVHQQHTHHSQQPQPHPPGPTSNSGGHTSSPPHVSKAKRAGTDTEGSDRHLDSKRRKESASFAAPPAKRNISRPPTLALDTDSGRTSPKSAADSDPGTPVLAAPAPQRRRTTVRLPPGVKHKAIAPHSALQAAVFQDTDMVPFLSLQSVKLATTLSRLVPELDLAQNNILLARANALQHATEQIIEEVRQMQEQLAQLDEGDNTAADAAMRRSGPTGQISSAALTVLNAILPRTELPLNPLELGPALNECCAALDRAEKSTNPKLVLAQALRQFRHRALAEASADSTEQPT